MHLRFLLLEFVIDVPLISTFPITRTARFLGEFHSRGTPDVKAREKRADNGLSRLLR